MLCYAFHLYLLLGSLDGLSDWLCVSIPIGGRGTRTIRSVTCLLLGSFGVFLCFPLRLDLKERLVKEVEVLVIYSLRFRKHTLELRSILFVFVNSLLQGSIPIVVVFVELIFVQIKCLTQLNSYLLLLQEDELIVLHVLFSVCF